MVTQTVQLTDCSLTVLATISEELTMTEMKIVELLFWCSIQPG